MGRSGSRRWAWHRLSSRWAERIVAHADVGPGDLVLDVGAGDGALTGPLARAGARVIAVEAHPGRADRLAARFAGCDVKVVRVDATDLRLPRRPFRVVANPPFTATVGLLKRLLAPGSRLVQADLVLPRHTALRWAEGRAPGAGRLAQTYRFDLVATVPPEAFSPPPPRPPVVLRITRR